MLLPQALLDLRHSVEPMVMTDIARAVTASAQDYLGPWGGITGLLAIDTGWVNEFESYARILAEVVPGVSNIREARAMAGRTPGLYVPGTGVLINGALLSGRTHASLDKAVKDTRVAARTALHLAHEVAGHAYMAENTSLGLGHARRESWRQSVSFAARVMAQDDRLTGAEAALLATSQRIVVVAEGWARWITQQLKPLLAERLPHLAADIAMAQPGQTHVIEDGQAAAMLDDAIEKCRRSGQLGRDVIDLFAEVSCGKSSVTPRAFGLALFCAIERHAGGNACVEWVHEACRGVQHERPDAFLARKLAQV